MRKEAGPLSSFHDRGGAAWDVDGGSGPIKEREKEKIEKDYGSMGVISILA